ncbi:MAG: DUF4846 domain-containing protein [Spirochaetes bacterium]|nr:DUF4846 domain-containing protein [Spirochaetota bacterium]
MIKFTLPFILIFSCMPVNSQNYSMINPYGNTVRSRINIPAGYARINATAGSFADYLRNLPCLPDGSNVILYNNRIRTNASQAAVLDISIGNTDLQQCADAIIRIRAEYLYSAGRINEISFNLTNGFPCSFEKWSKGYRVKIKGNRTEWIKTAAASSARTAFDKYLTFIFNYAGTYSMSQQCEKRNIDNIQIGDIFIQGGFPGHAIIVLDMAENKSGKKIILLAQSYMPAQSIHVLKNPESSISPWFELNDPDYRLITPDWNFTYDDLKKL